jgi:hemoglobin
MQAACSKPAMTRGRIRRVKLAIGKIDSTTTFLIETNTMRNFSTIRSLALLFFAALFSTQSSAYDLSSLKSIYSMVGGDKAVAQISNDMLVTAASDSRLKPLFGNTDVKALAPKVTEQICAILGGDCTAPLSTQQVADGAKELDASQTSALTEAFNGALSKSGTNSATQGLVSKAVGPQLGGIIGGLL